MKNTQPLTTILISVCILGLTACGTHKISSNLIKSTKKFETGLAHKYHNKVIPGTAIDEWEELNSQYTNNYLAGNYSSAENIADQALVLAEREFGHKSSYTLTSMHSLANLYKAQGHFKKAEPLFVEALTLMEELLGKQDPETLSCMNNLARLYQDQGLFDKAGGLFVETLALRKDLLGKHHPDTLSSMNNLAGLYQAQGYLVKAEPRLLETLSLMKEFLGKRNPETLSCMTNLALLYFSQGLFDKAELLFVEIFALRKDLLGQRHPETLKSMVSIATMYLVQGHLEKAEPLFVEALILMKNVLGKQHSDTLTSMNNLASLYLAQGHFNKAEPLFVEVLALKKDLLGKLHPETLVSMNSLAVLYQEKGLFNKAEPLFIEVLILRKNVLGKRHTHTLNSMNNLARLYLAQGRFNKAESLFVECLTLTKDVLGKWHPTTLTAMNNLSLLYQDRGLFNKAEPLLVDTLNLRKEVQGKRHPSTLISMGNLAVLYQVQGHFDKAEPLLVDAMTLSQEVLGRRHPKTLISMNNMALLYHSQGRFKKGVPLLFETLSLSIAVLGKQHPETLNTLFNLTFFHQKYQQWKRAKFLHDKYLFHSNQFLQQVLWGAGEKTRLSYLQQQESKENNYLSFYSHLISNTAKESKESWNNPSALAQQAWKLSISRKGLLLHIASETRTLSKLHHSKDPQLATLSQKIKETRSQIAGLTFSDKANPKQQTELEDQLNNLQRQLSSKASSFRDKNKTIQPEHILSALSKRQAVVDFLVYKEVDLKTGHYKKEQIIAFVANPETGVHFIKLGELTPITKLIQTYRESIESNDNNDLWFASKERQQSLIKTSQALYKKLWQPLSHALGNKKQIYLIPDGILHLLPFKALQNEQGKYLEQQVELTRLGSARDIVFPKQATPSNKATIIANPVYSAKSDTAKQQNKTISRALHNLNFSPLPGTKTESEQIQKILQQLKHPVNLYTQEQASEATIIKEKSPRLLHIATHGFFLEKQDIPEDKNPTRGIQWNERGKLAIAHIENPLARSGLAFSYANQGINGEKQADGTDGILTALEVLDLDLEGTELVTLSACETSVGEINVGEGVYSLNRAFQEAGAKAVLSTLWSISDEATSLFMQKFYQRFLNKQSAQHALQETQEEFIKSEQWNDPFFWAAFVVVGLDE